ncbi:hypothetical protein [Pseudonocardia abyssalis]|uniref:Uncharacterized protein n=1 Tax=Pseudonocardia abyssalis TaxID=2792008 RepID=A0ABS6UXR5_9PSEU|nr:hypothetical protein [Pseudonocardia abyssalis]MBW0114835.1 hypothetical protein [Pseudonocardia abyssalis]MBW0137025.1 hypothetical protein [Pseudonocardia abyssalis]
MDDRFDGFIAGLGTASGLRAVVGHWPRSPLGAFTDVMVERPDGHRVLLAPSDAVAEFVSATYTFDEVRVGPVTARTDGVRWTVDAAPLALEFTTGTRPLLGLLLRAVPRRLAVAPAWIAVTDVVARRLLPGVRTRGSAGGGREEFYAALDLHLVTDAVVRWEGADQGALAPVDPPVRFGFGSTPRSPALTRVTTIVRSSGAGSGGHRRGS